MMGTHSLKGQEIADVERAIVERRATGEEGRSLKAIKMNEVSRRHDSSQNLRK
jgi:hypothetical protein